MRRFLVNDIVLKVLGLLLLTAAVLKGHELLAVPVANRDLWSWRPFLIFQVKSEMVLGIWHVAGVFRRLAWLVSLLCFGLFCYVTLYKGLTGAASCGRFGRIPVNPWITLTAIDLPVVIGLILSRPAGLFSSLLPFLRRRESMRSITRNFLTPFATPLRAVLTAGFTLVVLSTTTPMLALNQPTLAPPTYEVLEPETGVGKELPIGKYIDMGDELTKGTGLLLLYHYDCPDCQKALPQYEEMARDLTSNQSILQLAVIEAPPCGESMGEDWLCRPGRLSDTEEWFVTTPATILTCANTVTAVWGQSTPSAETIRAWIMELHAQASSWATTVARDQPTTSIAPATRPPCPSGSKAAVRRLQRGVNHDRHRLPALSSAPQNHESPMILTMDQLAKHLGEERG